MQSRLRPAKTSELVCENERTRFIKPVNSFPQTSLSLSETLCSVSMKDFPKVYGQIQPFLPFFL